MTRVWALIVMCGSAVAGNAAAPVEESRGSTRADTAAPAAEDTSRLTNLYYQLQVLQQEVQTLRGQVEEQQYQLRMLTETQREQYMDLDRRVATASAGSDVVAATPIRRSADGVVTVGDSPAGDLPSGASTGGTSPASDGERDRYTAAFNLMKERQFDESIVSFSRFVVDFPGGEYTPNAYYWLGELYLATADDENARRSFAHVINEYPGHGKLPDALYKMGVAYHRLGDNDRALEYLNRVQAEHPRSSAAGLAKNYAAELL